MAIQLQMLRLRSGRGQKHDAFNIYREVKLAMTLRKQIARLFGNKQAKSPYLYMGSDIAMLHS